MKMHFHMSLHLTDDVNIPDNNMISLITQSILTAWLIYCGQLHETACSDWRELSLTFSASWLLILSLVRLLSPSNNTTKQVKFAEIKNC